MDIAFDSLFLSKTEPCSVSGSELSYYHIRREITWALRCLEQNVRLCSLRVFVMSATESGTKNLEENQ